MLLLDFEHAPTWLFIVNSCEMTSMCVTTHLGEAFFVSYLFTEEMVRLVKAFPKCVIHCIKIC